MFVLFCCLFVCLFFFWDMDCYVFNWIQWVFIRGRSLRTIISIHTFMYHFHRWCKNVAGFKTLVTHSAVSHVLLLCSQLHNLASSVIYYWTDVQQYGTFLFICYLCVAKRDVCHFVTSMGFKKKKNLLFVVPKDHAPGCVVLKTVIHLSIIVSIYLHFSE